MFNIKLEARKLAFFIIILISFNIQAQTISLGSVYHYGKYYSGKMTPTLDYEIGVSVLLTHKIDVSASLYYYNSKYSEYISNLIWKENYWYIGFYFSYTFSSKPLLE